MSNPYARTLARAYRKAADALEEGTFVGEEHCGILVDEMGRCRHRPYHPTSTVPSLSDIEDMVTEMQDKIWEAENS